jgi:hypothetical protein
MRCLNFQELWDRELWAPMGREAEEQCSDINARRNLSLGTVERCWRQRERARRVNVYFMKFISWARPLMGDWLHREPHKT